MQLQPVVQISKMSSTGGGSGAGGSHDRDRNLKYGSGAAKRKAKQEREARESKVLSKVPKISELFLLKSGGDNATESNVEGPTDSQTHQHDQEAARQSTTITDNTMPTIPTTVIDPVIPVPDQSELSDEFPTSQSVHIY